MKKLKAFFRIVCKYCLITVASFLYSVSFCCFYQSNGISIGGFTGISQIINHLFPIIPIGIMTIVLNIPLFVVGVKIQGPKVLLQSLYCMAASSVFVDLVNKVYVFQPMNDLLLAAICGGVAAGIALGILIKIGATNGGSELAARLLKYKFHHISVGKICLIIDITVIILFAITFGDHISALYGIISMYVFSVAVDFIVYGGTHSKMAFIISADNQKIRQKLLDMNLGVTMVDSHGGWKDDSKEMILCAFRPRQIAAIKATVVATDPNAFIIVCDAHEVLGEGFHTYSPDDL